MNNVRLPIAAAAIGSFAYNAHRGAKVLNPIHFALAGGVGALFYKAIYRISNCAIPTTPLEDYKRSRGAYTKMATSAGLAVWTTAEAMKYAGLTSKVPHNVKVMGLTCLAVLAVFGGIRLLKAGYELAGDLAIYTYFYVQGKWAQYRSDSPSDETSSATTKSSSSSSGEPTLRDFEVPRPINAQEYHNYANCPYADTSAPCNMLITTTRGVNGVRTTFKQLTVTAGPLGLDNCTMTEDVISRYSLTAMDTTFEQGLYICGGYTTLIDCTINNLFIDDEKQDTNIEIVLDGTTKVNGAIIFKRGNGTVKAGPVVTVGTVVGGTITDL